jgi:hypothetical protein
VIVEGFDNAWHVLRHWLAEGYECFALEQTGKVPLPYPCHRADLPDGAELGLDYFPLPPVLHPNLGDNPAEILLATAIAEGWEPQIA